MKIRPIIFRSLMVRKILDGHKTETRRLHDRYNMQVGDVFWIREPWAGNFRVKYKADCQDTKPGKPTVYNLTKWKSPLIMPRLACRLFLQVTEKRKERLQDINEAGVMAEGIQEMEPAYLWASRFPRFIKKLEIDTAYKCQSAKESFESLWDCIAKPGFKWTDNPEVFVFQFKIYEVIK